MKKLYKYATGLLLTGALSVMVVFNADAQRGAAHASSGGGGGGGNSGGGGGGISFSRGGFGGSAGFGSSIRPSYGVGYRSPFAYNYGYRSAFGYWGYPSLGFYLNALPYGYYPFYMGASMYYYADGAFYQPYDNGYVVTAPPVGAAVPGLPKGAKSINIDGQQFFEYRGVYYKVIVNDKGDTVYVVAGKDGVLNTGGEQAGAEVAVPQVGDIVNQLPEDTRSITLNGKKYYVSADGVYYEAIAADGKTVYRIASVPEQ